MLLGLLQRLTLKHFTGFLCTSLMLFRFDYLNFWLCCIDLVVIFSISLILIVIHRFCSQMLTHPGKAFSFILVNVGQWGGCIDIAWMELRILGRLAELKLLGLRVLQTIIVIVTLISGWHLFFSGSNFFLLLPSVFLLHISRSTIRMSYAIITRPLPQPQS